MPVRDRHRKVKELFLYARELDLDARAAWLDEACGDDGALRGEVESLLAAEERMPPAYLESRVDLGLKPGSHISHYRIVQRLGAGGMGEVWLAHDETLDRRVALKLPAPDRLSNSAVRDRLLREARAAAALEHPAVCRVFELGDADGHTFIAMELVEGETVAARLARGLVPLAHAISWASDIAGALEEAHGKGIVHRDLKSTNVMVTAAGQVKVMDFGLARALPGFTVSDPAAWRASLTAAGTIIGTPAYMAPEQLRGEAADERADIWALGCVLYELLTGTRPFSDPTATGLVGEILHVEPTPLSERRPGTPRALERVVRKCLAKDPKGRWHSAHDLRDELQWLAEGHAEATLSSVAVQASPRHVTCASVLPPDAVTGLGVPSLSNDGRTLVFEAWPADGPAHLWLRVLSGSDARPLPGTESGTLPFFSPDGHSIGFFADGALKTIDLASGRVVILAQRGGLFAAGTWAGQPPGVILFSSGVGSGLQRIAGAGGSVAEVTSLDAIRGDRAHLWPHFLPDGKHFLFVIQGEESGIYVGSLERGTIRRVVETRPLPATAVAYSPSGHLVYLDEATLLAQPFDLTRLQVTADPVRVSEGVSYYGPGVSSFSISQEGTLVFRQDTGWPLWQPVWLDRSGRELGDVGPPGPYWSGTPFFRPSLSPDVFRPSLSLDGRRLALTRRQAHRHPQIWILDLQRATASPFSIAGFNGMPIWSPAGDRLMWGRAADVHMRSIAAPGEGEPLLPGEHRLGGWLQRWPADWSRSGRYVLIDQESAGPTEWDLFVVDLEGEGRPCRPYLATSAMERTGVFSPDERFVAYCSDISGTMEIYLSTFPEHGERWQISRGGGMMPLWAPTGQELYYAASDQRVMVVRVQADDAGVSLSEPELLFRHESSGHLVVSRDGTRFLGLRTVEPARVNPFTLVLDWPQMLIARS